MKMFKNKQGQLRPIWWVAIFYLVLASLTFPLLLLSQNNGWEITITHQAFVVLLATWISQVLHKKPMAELFGQFNLETIKNALLGLVIGTLLMLLPALFLTVFDFVRWKQGSGEVVSLLNISGAMFAAAVAEEVLFRGFVFQQLRKATGVWIAQLLLAAYFLLTHMNNPGMSGSTRAFASINIFFASIMFGLAYVKTNNLIMPITFHFMANWVQGTLLGFGVSGNQQPSLLQPAFHSAPEWCTGGRFGLEASAPGFVCVISISLILYFKKPFVGAQTTTSAKYSKTKRLSSLRGNAAN